jgi:hypothetical protein
MSGDGLTDIRVTLARIEERQEAALQRFRSIDQKLDTFALRSELEPLGQRIDRMERTQAFILRSAMIGFSTVMGGLYALGKKLGLS